MRKVSVTQRALVALVVVYRRIPPAVRRRWSGGCSTSESGLAAVRTAPTTLSALWVLAGYAAPRVRLPRWLGGLDEAGSLFWKDGW